jgi:dTDP-4-amino-4,6-dideoxygalactose transaminase
MYIPAWPSLDPACFVRSDEEQRFPFPLSSVDSEYFYVARNGIYHLFRGLGLDKGAKVLVPDYHHGNEIYAMRAAGAQLYYYPVTRDLTLDLNAVSDLCKSKPLALYVTHFIGWPQPMAELKAFCRERNMLLIEDCALSLLSSIGDHALGTFGDYSVFCLYKTLPVPNGGVLVRNNGADDRIGGWDLKRCSNLSVAARSVELMSQWFRMRYETTGRVLFAVKRAAGRTLNIARVQRTPVGNTGFDTSSANIAMSPVSRLLLRRFKYDVIKEARRRNFHFLEERLRGLALMLPRKLEDGVCPLFFPLLVQDKQRASRLLWEKGIDTVEFWNEGDPEARKAGTDAEFLRKHVLEVPIHQDLSLRQLEYVAEQIKKLAIVLSP